MIPRFIFAVVVALLTSGCARPDSAPIDKKVNIGTHALYVRCVGKGTPVVVIDGGAGEFHTGWQPIQDALAPVTRVFAYDRAGYGESEPGPAPRHARQEAQELRLLLEKAGVEGPFLLVGHSLGGLNMQVFAAEYPHDVAGMVLLDPPPLGWITSKDAFPELNELFDQQAKDLTRGAALMDQSGDPAERAKAAFMRAVASEFRELFGESARQVAAVGSFGDLPLTVIASGQANPFFGESAADFQRFWIEQNREVANKSTRGKFVLIEESSHEFVTDVPDKVTEAIRSVITEIREPGARGSERDTDLLEKIDRVEHGLIAFTPGGADTTQPPVKLALSERMAHYKIPGASIAVIDHNRIEWAKGYGTLVAGSPAPVTPESIFQAASTTKLLVSAVVLHYVERDRLHLDNDVNAYLRSWKIPENEFTAKEKVTLRRLLTHRSGLNRPEGGFSWEDGSAPTLAQVLKGESPATNHPAVVGFEPGSRWEYSNFDFVVIQLLLEDTLGKTLNQIAREIVFDPLGMTSSTLDYPLSPDLAAREAIPHDPEGNPGTPALNPTAVAQGGLLTTPSDLALLAAELVSAYQGKSGRLISQETARRMFHTEVELDPRILGFPLGQGLGAFVTGEGKAFAFLHPGDNGPGASSWLVAYPETGQGVVFMTNGAMGNMLAMEIVAALTAEYGWPTK